MRRKLCGAMGCQAVAEPGQPYCAEHAAQRLEKERVRRAKAQTSAVAMMGRALYADPRWVKASKRFLREHPLCADCEELGVVEPATDVDHIKPHRGDQVLFWDRENWQALCHRCHSRKTARETLNRDRGGI